MSSDQATKKAPEKKRRRRMALVILVLLIALVVAGAFELKIIKIPKCHPAIQQEVDWPPEEHGFYEEASHNLLRSLEEGGFSPPGTVSVCNVPGAPAAQVVAHVPAEPRFLIFQPGQTDWEYHLYHSVEVPETGECVRVRSANRVEGLSVEPDPNNAEMVWIESPDPLDPEQKYMLTAGSDIVRGVIVTSAAPPE